MKLTERGKERGGLPRRSRLEREWGARGFVMIAAKGERGEASHGKQGARGEGKFFVICEGV